MNIHLQVHKLNLGHVRDIDDDAPRQGLDALFLRQFWIHIRLTSKQAVKCQWFRVLSFSTRSNHPIPTRRSPDAGTARDVLARAPHEIGEHKLRGLTGLEWLRRLAAGARICPTRTPRVLIPSAR